MNRSLVGALSALLLGGATLVGAGAAPATAASPAKAPAPAKVSAKAAKAPKAVDFAGTVALSNCSGSVVRTPGSADSDPALVLSNGHCLESGFPGAGEVIVDQPSSRSFTLLTASGGRAGTVRASKVAYATMTDTDISLYQLTSTYAQIQSSYGIKALTLSDSHPTQGSAINVVSGYWKKIYSCNIDGFAYRLKEGDWTWKDSVRYTSACNTIGGTSGSPVVDPASGKVVAVNNTGNEDGGRCTLNNPCEVDENGTVTVRQGINYAQETYPITKCVTTGNKINLNLAGCVLPKP
ncbi:serine protease [Streptomyces sp. DSM 41524]|uniref:Serine protease n=1 Tax=Streptomyces asiaticus subsp. ignotus TaxID=3098222 RepID=A0ABU7Q2G4_9ACTN|nr:serine protease [Streptomyces sp. DASNCL29]MEE4594871.1 serine protease [Streptomyces sp. DSM 41524]TMU92663.1 trypsin-like peptidase domain-containing protein [Streptomyces sp. DASNCL29]